MYRINKVGIDLLLLLILSVGSMSAQVVTTTSSGYPAIDLSALNPLGAVLSSAEATSRHAEMKQRTPSNTALLLGDLSVSGHNGSWNAKMSKTYQVMRADLGGATDWAAAWNACQSYSGEDGGAGSWRLPTQRELQMIGILHPQLIGKGGFTAFGATTYWSSSEGNAADAWLVIFTNGLALYNSKTLTCYVRCVRDL